MESLHQPGDIIAERYRITEILGQGGVGITYKAEDLKSGQQVALKALSLRRMGDWKVLELFEREARILAQLDHPAIPRYLDYFQVDTPEDRGYYIAQQLAEGKSLAELVEIGWRTNESGVRRIATQILEILIYLHDLKPPVVHRDIKPQNLIWGKDGKISLVDFGAVQDTYRSTLAKGSTIVGTYAYMAPEQFRGQAVPATDLYGLGTTLLFLLTHRSPSDLPQERLKISFRSRIQVSEGFADWLEKMLEPDVEDRFSSAKEALDALQGRMIVAKARSSLSWKALVGVGVVAVATVTVLNSYKWAVLGALGFQPSGICGPGSGNINVLRDYLKQGGDINAKDAVDDWPMLPCLLSVKNSTKDYAELVIAKLPDVNTKDNQGKTPLHMAGSKEMASLLIAKGADVNAKDNQGQTPLHFAYSNSKEVASLLIAKGADVNALDNQGKTPMHSAVEKYAKKDLVELLIAKGADVNAKDNQGKTPLDTGFQGVLPNLSDNAIALLKLLIAKGAHFSKNKARDGASGLHSTKSKQVAELLIAGGADVNAKDLASRTPLNLIIFWYGQERAELAELLIAKGADVNTKDNKGTTPLHWAVARAWQDMVELLIAKGADVNAKDNRGYTPLHWAAANRHREVAEMLIAKGANINAKDNKSQTPLQLVISLDECSSYRDMVELLIAKGADVNVKGAKGKTALHLAAVYDWRDIAELLIAKGLQVTAKDNEGMTPLHWAAGYGRKEVAQLLIAKGSQVRAKDNMGRTPLHWASGDGHRDVAELLIANGAEVNAKRNDGMTPLHRAVTRDRREVVELLLSKGAQVNVKDNEGKTPLSMALEKGDKNMIELLESHGGTN
jgi:ankyrin repeat protein